MTFNYHTHTARCHHASGDDHEYVEAAIKAGMKVLGFSDHAPYVFPGKHYYSSHRMLPEETGHYVESIRALAKEYRDDIRILCGFELEYYPDYHQTVMTFLQKFKPDYILLGQHFLDNELSGTPVFSDASKRSDLLLSAYVTQTIAGMATGDFLYVCHPDMIGTRFTKEAVAREFRRLCDAARRYNMPVELNLHGFATNRYYPSKTFFEIAAKVGNKVILGVDAHAPEELHDKETVAKAMKLARELKLHVVSKPLL